MSCESLQGMKETDIYNPIKFLNKQQTREKNCLIIIYLYNSILTSDYSIVTMGPNKYISYAQCLKTDFQDCWIFITPNEIKPSYYF